MYIGRVSNLNDFVIGTPILNRGNYKEIDEGLNDAESKFYKGEYRESLDISIKATSIVDESLYKKLLSLYDK